jgi:hypothetical protein
VSVAEDFAAELSIWDLTGDLTDYAEAIGQMYAQVELFAADTETQVGWQPLWDVDLMPAYGLPWLAQTVGERIPVGLAEDAAREQIRKTPNQFRGTPSAIIDAVKAPLTGGKRVWFRERFNGSESDEDWIAIATYASETPDERAVLNALRRTVPGDIDVFYEVLTGATWALLETPVTTWGALEVTYGPTWANIAGATPGGEYHE